MYKITIIAGARPNFMKIAPIIHAIAEAKVNGQQKITIFLIDEIFDNFDMINIEKVIQYCAENKFQTFFSTTDNFALQGVINNLEMKEIT